MTMPTSDFELSLDAATKDRHDRLGFATIPRLTSDEEAIWFGKVYDRLLIDRLETARQAGRIAGPGKNTLWISLNRWEAMVLERTSLVRNARRMAAGLLEVAAEEIAVGIRFFYKPARGGLPVPWHQDEAHKDPSFDHRSVNVWVPLDAATESNGCLHYIPESHLGGIREHRHPGHGAPEIALVTDDVRPCEAVDAPVPVVGAAFHHCRTVHGSGANLTDGHRRAMALVCSALPRPRAVPADRPWINPAHLEVPETSF
ncbi:MAG TPA: phytanoyl-CoA dioxygenase family protein [Polyangia bacterium]|jgi:hypothetical protein|nr:phytanoyl-CoA dioxygenase family protein [Polyangia bacterium]